MRSKALAVLFAVAIVGCGGGNDSNDTTAASQAPEQNGTTAPAAKAPTKLVGARTKANVAKALAYEKQGDVYGGAGGCQFKDIAPTKKDVEALAKIADPPNALVKNDSGTAGVLIAGKVSYFCAIQAANHLKFIP